MKLSYILIGCVALSAAVVGFAVEATSHEKATVKTFQPEAGVVVKKTTLPYQKPGAAIRFDHDFKGPIEPGSSTSFTLSMREDYNSGTLYLDVNTLGSSLELAAGSRSAQFDLANSHLHDMTISLTALDQGRHYVNVLATVDANGQTSSRAYAVAVQVGDPAQNKPNAMAKHVRITPEGERIIVMKAQETINGVPQE